MGFLLEIRTIMEKIRLAKQKAEAVLVLNNATYNTHTALFGDYPSRDYLSRPVPEETFTHSHPSCSSDILYQLPLSTTIYSILLVQFTHLTVLFHNVCQGPLWSSSWSGTVNFILYAFLHPIIFSQHMPIPSQPVLL